MRPKEWWINTDYKVSKEFIVGPHETRLFRGTLVVDREAYDIEVNAEFKKLEQQKQGAAILAIKHVKERDQALKDVKRLKEHCEQMDSNLNFCQEEIRAIAHQRDSARKAYARLKEICIESADGDIETWAPEFTETDAIMCGEKDEPT